MPAPSADHSGFIRTATVNAGANSDAIRSAGVPRKLRELAHSTSRLVRSGCLRHNSCAIKPPIE